MRGRSLGIGGKARTGPVAAGGKSRVVARNDAPRAASPRLGDHRTRAEEDARGRIFALRSAYRRRQRKTQNRQARLESVGSGPLRPMGTASAFRSEDCGLEAHIRRQALSSNIRRASFICTRARASDACGIRAREQ
jgi:hypothetical protein